MWLCVCVCLRRKHIQKIQFNINFQFESLTLLLWHVWGKLYQSKIRWLGRKIRVQCSVNVWNSKRICGHNKIRQNLYSFWSNHFSGNSETMSRIVYYKQLWNMISQILCKITDHETINMVTWMDPLLLIIRFWSEYTRLHHDWISMKFIDSRVPIVHEFHVLIYVR